MLLVFAITDGICSKCRLTYFHWLMLQTQRTWKHRDAGGRFYINDARRVLLSVSVPVVWTEGSTLRDERAFVCLIAWWGPGAELDPNQIKGGGLNCTALNIFPFKGLTKPLQTECVVNRADTPTHFHHTGFIISHDHFARQFLTVSALAQRALL